MRPQRVPIGLQLGRASRVVSRAFDSALEEAGGTLPIWLILLNLKIRRPDNQRELAEAVGVREATLTHHLNAMDTRGLITRRRDTENRRTHVVELTDDGKALFERLQQAAVAFDTRLRNGLAEADVDTLGALLDRLAANVGESDENTLPWAGLAEKH
jgi:MarR family transcriptional regulator for hemolysin